MLAGRYRHPSAEHILIEFARGRALAAFNMSGVFKMSKKQINRRDFIRAAGATGVGLMAGGLPAVANLKLPVAAGTQSAAGLTTPKLETVRLAFIGVGARGSGH